MTGKVSKENIPTVRSECLLTGGGPLHRLRRHTRTQWDYPHLKLEGIVAMQNDTDLRKLSREVVAGSPQARPVGEFWRLCLVEGLVDLPGPVAGSGPGGEPNLEETSSRRTDTKFCRVNAERPLPAGTPVPPAGASACPMD